MKIWLLVLIEYTDVTNRQTRHDRLSLETGLVRPVHVKVGLGWNAAVRPIQWRNASEKHVLRTHFTRMSRAVSRRRSIDHYTTFYWSAIVSIAPSATVFELFDIEWYHDPEIWVWGHSRSFKMVLFESLGAVSYSPSIVTKALSCINSEIKPDISRKSWFFHAPLHSVPPLGGSPSEYCHPVWYG